MTEPFNKIGAIKEAGAILNRLQDATLNDGLKFHIIKRHCANLRDTLPVPYWGILRALGLNTEARLWVNVEECALALRAAIPLTYGCVTAGTCITIGAYTGHKRKEGFEIIGLGLQAHPSADSPVQVINH